MTVPARAHLARERPIGGFRPLRLPDPRAGSSSRIGCRRSGRDAWLPLDARNTPRTLCACASPIRVRLPACACAVVATAAPDAAGVRFFPAGDRLFVSAPTQADVAARGNVGPEPARSH